jgi:hypothetical protein
MAFGLASMFRGIFWKTPERVFVRDCAMSEHLLTRAGSPKR